MPQPFAGPDLGLDGKREQPLSSPKLLPPDPARPARPWQLPWKPLQGKNAAVFGLKGAGKTSLNRALLRHHSRCLIVDPQREYGDLGVELADFDQILAYLERLEASGIDRWRISYWNDHLEDDFEQLCRFIYLCGRCHLLIDEADRFCSPYFIGPDFFQVVQYGRHAKRGPVTVQITARRPASVHRDTTSQSFEFFCFMVHEANDLKYLKDCGLPEDFYDRVSKLDPLHCLYRNMNDPKAPTRAFVVDPRTLAFTEEGFSQDQREGAA